MKLICGDALTELRKMDPESVQCCVTSPPYWGLRDYGVEGQIGLEKTPEEYTARMVELFGAVWRLLRNDGTLWLNLGDSYNGGAGGRSDRGREIRRADGTSGKPSQKHDGIRIPRRTPTLKSKDLVGIPWRVAFALQADGWYLRADIIWSKPNPMPESVTDRPTKAHEYIFLLSKAPNYYYDAAAIKEPSSGPVNKMPDGWATYAGSHGTIHKNGREKGRSARDSFKRDGSKRAEVHPGQSVGTHRLDRSENDYAMDSRNKRSVWNVSVQPFPEAHFAVFPPRLIQPCILAGCPEGGTVLDPFTGSGTTGIVAINEGRDFVGIELNPEYVKMAEARIKKETAQQKMFV